MLLNKFSVLMLCLFPMLAHADVIKLDVAVGETAPLNRFVTREYIRRAERCINSALMTAGHPSLRVFMRPELRTLTEGEEQALPAYDFEPALTKTGYPLQGMETGATAQVFTIFVSNRIPRSHVKSVWTSEIPLEDRIQALKLSEARERCERFFNEEVQPLIEKLPIKIEEQQRFNATTERYREICFVADRMEHSATKHHLAPSSEIYIAPKAQTDLTLAIAHTFVRSWGGLAELSQKVGVDQNNLMSKTPTCRLTAQQVQSIFEFRKTGVPQL